MVFLPPDLTFVVVLIKILKTNGRIPMFVRKRSEVYPGQIKFIDIEIQTENLRGTLRIFVIH